MRPIWIPVSVSYSFLHSTSEIDFFVVVNDLANWRDNCSSSAKSAFCEVFDFIQIYFTFLNFESEIMFSNIDQGTTCDGWKDAVGLRCYNSAVFGYEDEVCSTCLLNFGSCCGVKVHVLIVSLTMCIHDRMKAHCVVKASFDVSCSMRCSTVKVCDTDRDRLCATLEVWSYWCGQDTELIFISRFNTDNRVASEHVRTYIQGCT